MIQQQQRLPNTKSITSESFRYLQMVKDDYINVYLFFDYVPPLILKIDRLMTAKHFYRKFTYLDKYDCKHLYHVIYHVNIIQLIDSKQNRCILVDH